MAHCLASVLDTRRRIMKTAMKIMKHHSEHYGNNENAEKMTHGLFFTKGKKIGMVEPKNRRSLKAKKPQCQETSIPTSQRDENEGRKSSR